MAIKDMRRMFDRDLGLHTQSGELVLDFSKYPIASGDSWQLLPLDVPCKVLHVRPYLKQAEGGAGTIDLGYTSALNAFAAAFDVNGAVGSFGDVAKLNQTISGAYAQAEVQALTDKVDELIDSANGIYVNAAADLMVTANAALDTAIVVVAYSLWVYDRF